MDDHHRRYCNHCREEIPEKRLRRGSSFCSSECHRDDPERLDRAYPNLAPRPEMATGQPETGKPLNNQDVLGMVEAGLPPKVLVAKIDRSPGAYDTSPDDLRQPKTAGVHDSIILAMVRAG